MSSLISLFISLRIFRFSPDRFFRYTSLSGSPTKSRPQQLRRPPVRQTLLKRPQMRRYHRNSQEKVTAIQYLLVYSEYRVMNRVMGVCCRRLYGSFPRSVVTGSDWSPHAQLVSDGRSNRSFFFCQLSRIFLQSFLFPRVLDDDIPHWEKELLFVGSLRPSVLPPCA